MRSRSLLVLLFALGGTAAATPSPYGGATYGGSTYGVAPSGDPFGGPPGASSPPRQVGRPSNPGLAASFGPARRFLETIAATHDIHGVDLRYVGDASGMQAPVARTPDGGFVVAVDLRTPTRRNKYAVIPLLYRLDARGNVLGKTDLRPRARYATYECAGVVVAPDGSARVLLQTYPTPGGDSIRHIVSVSKQGAVQWDFQLRGHGLDSPMPIVMNVDAQGYLAMRGYIVLAEDVTRRGDWTDAMSRWSGRLSARGSLIDDRTGDRMSSEERQAPKVRTDSMWSTLYPPTPWE